MKFVVALKYAKMLCGDGDYNTEYHRGVCEILAEIYGEMDVPHEDRTQQIADMLNVTINP